MEPCIRGYRAPLSLVRRLPAGTFYAVDAAGRRVALCDEGLGDGQTVVCVVPTVLGGKGGFGSLLRSFRISSASNQDMCRDISGRRVKSVKQEQELKEWISKKADRDAEKLRRKEAKLEKLRRGPGKHQFDDVDYLNRKEGILERTDDAVSAGLKATVAPAGGPEAPAAASSSSSSAPTVHTVVVDESGEAAAAAAAAPPADKDTFAMPVPLKRHKPNPPGEQPSAPAAAAGGGDKAAAEAVDADQPAKSDENNTEDNAESKSESPPPPPPKPFDVDDYAPADLDAFHSAADLAGLGLDYLKAELMRRRLKCGGSAQERAERLFSVKGLRPSEYPKKILAKK